jgi:hypothetical protein
VQLEAADRVNAAIASFAVALTGAASR